MGLHIDLFDPSLFEPTQEVVHQENMPLGHEVLQVSRNPTVEIKLDGPMPFSSRLADYAIGMGFNQGKTIIFDQLLSIP
jgi:hypothetical protein